MTNKIKNLLKERSKLTKYFYRNGQRESDRDIPSKIILKESSKHVVFPKIWKAANVVPVHKKEDKSQVKNYRPISLLLIFGKIFE